MTARTGTRRLPLKQLVASEPVSERTCAKACRRATVRNAKGFLGKLIRRMPFAVETVQVDGGSELLAEFKRGSRDIPDDLAEANRLVDEFNRAGAADSSGAMRPKRP